MPKRGISPIAATAVGLGAIIGAGIFVLSGTAIAIAGADSLVAFAIVGFVALSLALQLGELGSMMPKETGASYSFVYQAFGSELGFITGILLYFSFSTAISAVALGFGSYAAALFGISAHYASAYALYIAIAAITALALVNLQGIKKAANIDLGLVLVKLGILSIFIASVAMITIGAGHISASNFSVSAKQSGLGGIFAASIAIFFAYSGFSSISTFTSKIKGGASSAAKAIFFSVLISIIFYVLIVLVMIIAVPASSYGVTADPLSFVLNQIHAPASLKVIVEIGALVATASATLALILTSSRLIRQISKDGLLPKKFANYNRVRDTAPFGIFASSIIGVVMLFSGNIYMIAAISNFGLLFSYLLTTLALIHFRRRGQSGSFRSPFYPYLHISTIVLLLAFIFGMPKAVLEIGIIAILILIVSYYTLNEFKSGKAAKTRLFR